ncbi:MAG: pyrroline-5-carboxylate reductase [Deltaproteobacteria bacterium]|nr:pyrroline-5-carboxylate reductase [Deltaproteobacteria bacterium]
MFEGKRFAFVGAGNMADALIRGLLSSGVVPPDHVVLSGRRKDKCERTAERLGVRAAADNAQCVRGADVVVLCVKPQVLLQVFEPLGREIPRDALVVSVAAGVPTTALEAHLHAGQRVVRAMPNTCAVVRMGATAIAPGQSATEDDLELARRFFNLVGRAVLVDEVHLDAVTGLSGSGPAYIFLVIEALADAGVKVGLARDVGLELAAQTVLGSAQMLLQTGEHPGRLRDQVTSPGGTAIAGLHTLEAGGLRTTLINAVETATRRARELGEAMKK